jgi:hypothetical protein
MYLLENIWLILFFAWGLPLGFLVTINNGAEKMYPGMIISYKLSPFL